MNSNDDLKSITTDFLMLKKISFDDILVLFNGYNELKNNYNGEKIWRVLSRYVNNNPDESSGFIYRLFTYNHFEGDSKSTPIFEYFIDGIEIQSTAIDDYFSSMLLYFGSRETSHDSSILLHRYIGTDRYIKIDGYLDNKYQDYDYSHSFWRECEPRIYQEVRYYDKNE